MLYIEGLIEGLGSSGPEGYAGVWYTITLGAFRMDRGDDSPEECLAPGEDVNFSSSARRFQDSISSSSMGVMPRMMKGRRPCLARKQAKTVAITRKRATTERTVLRVMTRVRLEDPGAASSSESMVAVAEGGEEPVVLLARASSVVAVGPSLILPSGLPVVPSVGVKEEGASIVDGVGSGA